MSSASLVASAIPARQALQFSQIANTSPDNYTGLPGAKELFSLDEKLSMNLALGLNTFSPPEHVRRYDKQSTTEPSYVEEVYPSESARLRIGLAMASPSVESDSEEEDPFRFDRVLSSTRSPPAYNLPQRQTQPAACLSPRATQLAQSLAHRVKITPLSSSYSLSPLSGSGSGRYSFMRTRTDNGDMFVQQIQDESGGRWNLCVPASGLPEDMLRMLDELETLARELTEVIPRIVVTQSAQSLSTQLSVPQQAAAEAGVLQVSQGITESEKLSSITSRIGQRDGLPKAPTRNVDQRLHGWLASTDKAEEKSSLAECPSPAQGAEASTVIVNSIPATPTSCTASDATPTDLETAHAAPPIVPPSVPDGPSLHCIYLPDLAPELPSTEASPLPAPGLTNNYQSKPLPTARQRAATLGPASPRGNAFFAALDAEANSPVLNKGRRSGTSLPRIKAASMDHNDTARTIVPHHSPSATKETSSTPALVFPSSPKRVTSASPVIPSPPLSAPPVPKLRSRGKSLLHLRTRSSKANLQSTVVMPSSAPPQMPVYKWSTTAVAQLQTPPERSPPPPPPPPPPQKATLKGLFRRPASRSASEPPPYQPLSSSLARIRPISESVQIRAPPLTFDFDTELPEPEVEMRQKHIRRMPSAKDLFRKRK